MAGEGKALQELELSNRTRHTLIRYGIETLDDLKECTAVELEQIWDLGEKGRKEVLRSLRRKGISLAEVDDNTILRGTRKQLSSPPAKGLYLPYAACRILLENKIETVEELLSRSPADLIRLRGMGRRTLNAIERGLFLKGLFLKGSRKEDYLIRQQCANDIPTSSSKVKEEFDGISISQRLKNVLTRHGIISWELLAFFYTPEYLINNVSGFGYSSLIEVRKALKKKGLNFLNDTPMPCDEGYVAPRFRKKRDL
jgi:DNA-directed RNA polymerase alpha subunit